MNPLTLSKPKTKLVRGVVISPGLAHGFIHIQRSLLGPIDVPVTIHQESIEDEYSRLESATASISDDLINLATRVEKEIDVHLAEVFETHQLIVNDALLKEELHREIAENLVCASSAVKQVFLRWEKRFLMMESQIARDKGDDMRDISIRLRNALAGITVHPLEKIPKQCVLAISRLLPSDTVFLAEESTVAILLEYGNFGSHAALFTREMGLPCLSGIRCIESVLPDKSDALIDADRGFVIVNPRAKELNSFKNKQTSKAIFLKDAQEKSRQPAVTLDGVTVSVVANISCARDTDTAMLNGADGIGLYRLEQIYLGRATPPTVDELFEEICHALMAARDYPICVRLLDIGADKPLPFLGFLAESNPALGRRGIRLLREYPELLDTQLRALLRLDENFKLSILIPMVTLADDILFVKERLRQLCNELNIVSPPRLGAMIETPAAALAADSLSELVDFFSFGTNDLTQYAFAADRENAAVDRYYQNTSAVIFRFLQLVHDDVPDMPLSLCGELAGRREYIEQLLRCGIRTLSVAAPLIPQVKEAIREASLQDLPSKNMI